MLIEEPAKPVADPADNRREFRRIGTGVRVVYRWLPMGRNEREYLHAVAEDVSLGGMFLATPHPLPRRSVLSIEFYPPGSIDGTRPVRARAVVCWRRRWRSPRGMGIKFLEFEGLGQQRLETWIDTVLSPASVVF